MDPEFSKIFLQPMSLRVLEYLVEHADEPPKKSSEIGDDLGLNRQQVDAIVTRTLVRHSFARREGQLTELRKKMYNVIVITERGKQYWKYWVEEGREVQKEIERVSREQRIAREERKLKANRQAEQMG